MKKIVIIIIFLFVGNFISAQSSIDILNTEINLRVELQKILNTKQVLESKAYLTEGFRYEVCTDGKKEFLLDKRKNSWSISTETDGIYFMVDSTENIIEGSINFSNNLDYPLWKVSSETLNEKTFKENKDYWLSWIRN